MGPLSETVGAVIALPARYTTVFDAADAVAELLPEAARSPLVLLGITEALSNGILHGALSVPSTLREQGELEGWLAAIEQAEAACGDRSLRVTVAVAETEAHLAFDDGGHGFDWQRTSAAPGRGLSLIASVFDEVRWNDRGNCLHVRLPIPARTPAT
jgi:hypothetical protein